MEIRTKFNPSDKVWVADKNWTNTFEVFFEPIYKGIVERITTETKNKTIVFYTLSMSDSMEKEEDCFATKEEAQKECDRRNEK